MTMLLLLLLLLLLLMMIMMMIQSLSAAHELDMLYNSGHLKTILEDIFTCLLKSTQAVHIKTLTWPVSDYNNCVQYFLENLSK